MFQPYLILSALAVLPEISILILEAGCGQNPRKIFLLLMPDWYAKNQNRCIKKDQLVILLSERNFDNIDVTLFDNKFLHI